MPSVCKAKLNDVVKAAKAELTKANKIGHDTSKGGPPRGEPVKPVGDMKDSNCKEPGDAPAFPKPKACPKRRTILRGGRKTVPFQKKNRTVSPKRDKLSRSYLLMSAVLKYD